MNSIWRPAAMQGPQHTVSLDAEPPPLNAGTSTGRSTGQTRSSRVPCSTLWSLSLMAWYVRLICGVERWRLTRFNAARAQDKAVFDSSYLDITAAALASGTTLEWDLSPRLGAIGSALTIKLPHALSKGDKIELVITYATTKQCTALGWLQDTQTDSGLYPFLFSQNQAIHCRSLIRESVALNR